MMKTCAIISAGWAILVQVAAAKHCINMTVPVQISARNAVWDQANIRTNVDVAVFTTNYSSIAGGTNYTDKVTAGYQTVTGDYNISAKFCMPDNGAGENATVQVLTHGIGFDKTYWDFPFNDFNYSYIDHMVDDYGYCTLSYDRLGIGNSSKADPYTVVQDQAQVSALYCMSDALRKGSFPGVNITFDGQSNKIVHVGHSFGSQQVYQLTLAYPNVSDAIVLTGFSFNVSELTLPSFGAKIARENQPMRFGSTNAAEVIRSVQSALGATAAQLDMSVQTLYSVLNQINITTPEAQDIYLTTSLMDLVAGAITEPYPIPQDLPSGYLTWSDAWANQYNFFASPFFDQTIVDYAESKKQPFTVGEILTLGGAPVASNFTGPVHIITGQRDAIYCFGDCLATGSPWISSTIEVGRLYFTQSRDFSAYVQPDMGHAINLHFNSTGAYAVIAEFLAKNMMSPMCRNDTGMISSSSSSSTT